MNEQESTMVVEALAAIPFFPTEAGARALISSELQRMCGGLEQAMWLARRVSQLYDKWPGMREVRAAFCGKYRPCDGIEADSAVYLEGIPAEPKPVGRIAASERKAIR